MADRDALWLWLVLIFDFSIIYCLEIVVNIVAF